MKKIVISFISLYQLANSLFSTKRRCVYYPTCSDYAKEAFYKKGLLKGVVLTTSRVVRCNPWSKGGIDLVN